LKLCNYCSKEITRKKSGKLDQLKYCNAKCSNAGRIRVKKVKPARQIKTKLYVWEDVNLAELRTEVPQANRYHAKLRGYSRRAYNGPKICAVCKYAIHVEIAHVISAKDFDINTKLSVVNAKDNLVALCRNHHWEFDNGYLLYDVDSKVWKVL
jgi:hypothetical protein